MSLNLNYFISDLYGGSLWWFLKRAGLVLARCLLDKDAMATPSLPRGKHLMWLKTDPQPTRMEAQNSCARPLCSTLPLTLGGTLTHLSVKGPWRLIKQASLTLQDATIFAKFVRFSPKF